MKYRITVFLLLIPLLGVAAFGKANSAVHEIPFEYELNKILIPVKVNGSKPLRTVFDTGMPGGVFIPNPAVGKTLNLDYLSTNVMVGGGGNDTKAASMAMETTLELGDLKLTGERAIVLNEADEISRFGFDAVIGASIFGKYVVEIDVIEKRIRLFDPKNYDPKGAGEELDLSITRTKPYITGTVNIDGKRSEPLKIVVDTGAGISMMVTNNEKKGVKTPAKSIEGIFGAGVGGDIRARGARLDSFQIGSHSLKGVTAQFSDRPVPANADALIGMRILKRFKMTFNYPGKKLYLKPNDSIGEKFDFDLFGIVSRPTADGKIKVIEVFKNSAGSIAGIQKGDVIRRVSGKAMSFQEWSIHKFAVKEPGKSIQIEIERNGKTIPMTIKSRRLI